MGRVGWSECSVRVPGGVSEDSDGISDGADGISNDSDGMNKARLECVMIYLNGNFVMTRTTRMEQAMTEME